MMGMIALRINTQMAEAIPTALIFFIPCKYNLGEKKVYSILVPPYIIISLKA
jgi:hypothetical protein